MLNRLLPGLFGDDPDLARQKIYRCARLGIVPHVKVGRRVLFVASELERFVREGGRGLPVVASEVSR